MRSLAQSQAPPEYRREPEMFALTVVDTHRHGGTPRARCFTDAYSCSGLGACLVATAACQNAAPTTPISAPATKPPRSPTSGFVKAWLTATVAPASVSVAHSRPSACVSWPGASRWTTVVAASQKAQPKARAAGTVT